MKTFYITTTLPYVNAEPHIGFAMEIVTADVLARYHQLMGETVIFNTGTDEHGQKIYQKAVDNQETPQQYADRYAALFSQLKSLLAVNYTHFVRTTDPHHIQAAQAFWQRSAANGDIYKRLYKVKYCVGCELEKTDSELVDGRCPLHPNQELEIIEEENYFFRFSKYQQSLLEHYRTCPDFVKPESKWKEMVAFAEHGLQDFSISRLKAKMPWGIEVPGDPDQVMYVWFDALINYISTLGWPEDTPAFEAYWPGTQIAGKDNLRQQSAMWQAMLLSAKLPLSKQILINGFISVNGQKMSKSLGNVISPLEMVDRYGVESTRFLLLNLGPVDGDIDVSWQKFDTAYNSYLANSLGNTVQRIATLAARSGFEFAPDQPPGFRSQVKDALESYRFAEALMAVWEIVDRLEKQIDAAKPWTLSGQPLKVFLTESIAHLRQLGYELQPFMPQTAEAISRLFTGPAIPAPTPLFPRLKTS